MPLAFQLSASRCLAAVNNVFNVRAFGAKGDGKTLDTIALSGFRYRFNSFYQNEMHPLIEAMVRALSEAGGRARRLPIQTTLMLRTQRQYEADGRFMHAVTEELIAKRRKMPEDEAPRDLLGLMLNAKDPVTGEHLDDTNIRYQLLTFLIAGHETTSGLLSFAIHLLLKHPEVLRKAQAEADRVLGADTPRFEQVAQLGYFDQILRETLRLWPTAPGFTVAPKHDTLDLSARNVSAVTIDAKRAKVNCAATLNVKTDGPLTVTIGRTAFRRTKRSKRAASSLPVSGLGHSFDAATHSLRGTLTTVPSPTSKVRSLRIFNRTLRMADDAFMISSRKQRWASGNLPVVTRR